MALKVKREENMTLTEELNNYFALPEDNDIFLPKDNYEDLKNKIYALKIDKEEKANIINKISSLKTKNDFERKKIEKEIEEFKKLHNVM